MSKKIKWSTIKVPKEFLEKLREVSENEGRAYWRVLTEALSFYVTQKKKPKKKTELPILDKCSWYIAKVSMSVGALKENPTEKNLNYLRRTLEQIEERLGIDTSLLWKIANDYAKEQSTHNKMELNMTLKMLIVDIICYALMPKLES